jgi:metal-responsive CopG/Arc/MetJ family transcriptional regulator
MSKNRSKVTIDLPDELIAELLALAKKQSVSVRQIIREAFGTLSRQERSSVSATMICNIVKKVH